MTLRPSLEPRPGLLRRRGGPAPAGGAGLEAARHISSKAVGALLREALLAPKPGLVDRLGRGAHGDMDIFSFADSAACLGPYFTEFALLGWAAGRNEAGGGRPGPRGLLEALRPLGIEAEAAMRDATGGANTHKGAIFSLGLLAAAAGAAAAEAAAQAEAAAEASGPAGLASPRGGRTYEPEALCARAAAIAGGIVERELLSLGLPGPGFPLRRGPITAGELSFAESGRTGARGEAASGFPTLRKAALPLLRAAAAAGRPFEPAALAALVNLIAVCEDSCILKRGGEEGLAFARRGAKALLESQGEELGERLEPLRAFGAALEARSLSPGGSADLLAAGVFLVGLEYPRWR